MKLSVHSILVALFLFTSVALSAPPEGYSLASPQPGSHIAKPNTGILLRPAIPVLIAPASNDFVVLGEVTGLHTGKVQVGSGGQALYFKPEVSFQRGERVEVTFAGVGNELPGFSYSFTISNTVVSKERLREIELAWEDEPVEQPQKQYEAPVANLDTLVDFEKASDYDLPTSFPPYRYVTSDNATPGYTYMAHRSGYYSHFFEVVYDEEGKVVFYGGAQEKVQLFQAHDDVDLISWFEPDSSTFHLMDSNWQEVRTLNVTTGMEYGGDFHECAVLPDRRVAILLRDYEEMDLTEYDGLESALVIGTSIQVFDEDNVLVFEWLSLAEQGGVPVHWTNNRGDIHSSTVDYMHSNAIELTADGNWLLSSRHTDAIYKISNQTGELIWVLGGTGNQFEYLDANYKRFSGQHDIRELDNGHLMMFDNGSFIEPTYARAWEFSVAEDTMTVSTDWYYDRDQSLYSAARGAARRLPNGNTIIAWGSRPSGNPHATEVDASGNILFEMTLLENAAGYESNYQSYRVFRSDMLIRPTVPLMMLDVESNDQKVYFAKFNDPDVVEYQLKFHETTSGTEFDTITAATSLSWDWLKDGEWQVVSRAIYDGGGVSGYSDTLLIDNGQWTGVTESPTGLPREFTVNSYPNPFNGTAVVTVALPAAGWVKYDVYDILGRSVLQGQRKYLSQGQQNLTLQLHDNASGVYLLRVEFPDGSLATRRLTLVR